MQQNKVVHESTTSPYLSAVLAGVAERTSKLGMSDIALGLRQVIAPFESIPPEDYDFWENFLDSDEMAEEIARGC